MARENLRPWCRWMPLWMLKIVFLASIVLVLLPVAIWDAVKDVFRELRTDWRDMIAEVEDHTP
jgi:hypothetical protein